MEKGNEKNEKLAYSLNEVSEATSLSKGFLRKEIKSKKLKIKRFGRRIVILSEDLKVYLNTNAE